MSSLGWKLEDLSKITPNGCNVFTTFACGGGSTMGYKLAGYEVIGANDIDPEMAQVYQTNHKPKHFYLKPIGELVEQFRRDGVPDYLSCLDLLDGSPPCSSFSTAGTREKDWTKKKRFREGQASQILNDLFFEYLNLLEILQPRTFVAENVTGMFKGKAKGYAKEVVKRAKAIGYKVQVFQINATACGVPQIRERLFFVGTKEEKADLVLELKSKMITQREACSDLTLDSDDLARAKIKETSPIMDLWKKTKMGEALSTVHPTQSFFSYKKNNPNKPAKTVTATAGTSLHGVEPRGFTWKELLRLGSFPDDYNLCEPRRAKWNDRAKYLVGMSVPPFMIRDLSLAIHEQWLKT